MKLILSFDVVVFFLVKFRAMNYATHTFVMDVNLILATEIGQLKLYNYFKRKSAIGVGMNIGNQIPYSLIRYVTVVLWILGSV